MESGSTILIFLAFIQATFGQTVTLTGPSAVERGRDTVFTCTGGETPFTFIWTDTAVNPNILIFTAGQPSYLPEDTKYVNFEVSENGDTSIMTIRDTQIEDEGGYRCTEGQFRDDADFTVEVRYTLTLSVDDPLVNGMDYSATCNATDGRPDLTITWMLGTNAAPCDDPIDDEISLTPTDPDLFSKSSVCTFQADIDNDGEMLRCVIDSHQVNDLNGEVTTNLTIHIGPTSTVKVVFQFLDPDLNVSCEVAPDDKSNPAIMNYYIKSNDTLIHEDNTGVDFTVVKGSDFNLYTEFTCTAGNYLGNTTSEPTKYDPYSTTTPPPTTGPEGLGAGAIAGICVGVIILIVLVTLLVFYCYKKKQGDFGGSGSNNAGSGKKHSTSAVGSSNGNEKEKIKPEAAPRGHSSIQHTNDNPDHAEYAMVDRTKPSGRGGGGDMPDTRGNGAGQNDQGMHYADLDLSVNAGHSERQVPQDKENVVVYSSILV